MEFDIAIGEIILVRLAKELALCRFERTQDKQIICSYNQKPLRVRQSNIMLTTRFVPKSDYEFQTFKNDCQTLAEKIDIESLWAILEGQNKALTLNEIADLYFSETYDFKSTTSMAILLDKDECYFKHVNDKYLPNSSSDVQRIKDFHRRTIQNEKDITFLLNNMSQSVLPKKLTSYQQTFLTHLKQYAIHGDDYKHKNKIKPFFLKDKTEKSIQRRIFDLLVTTKFFNKHEPLELHKIGGISIPDTSWVSDIKSKNAILLNSDRLDFRKADVITIDDEETKERDDAFSLKKTDGKLEFAIHISDPSTLINRDSVLDKSARINSSSIYLPEKTVPMLPSHFISEFGSLDPLKHRLGLSLLIKTDLNYEIENWKIEPSLISTTRSITYEQASIALKNKENRDHEMITHLWNFSNKQLSLRKRNGAINFQTQEISIKVNSDSEIEVAVLNSRLDSRIMVSELMILFNSLSAKFFIQNHIPAIYRHQPSPYLLENPDFDFNQTSENEISKNYHLIRNLPQTKLTSEPLPHYSLGLQSYLQITSPLRRYSDMLLQRQIIHFIYYSKYLYSLEDLKTLVYGTYSRTKDIKSVERERQKYWLIRYLENALNNRSSNTPHPSYSAVVLEKGDSGTKSLVQLIDFGFRQRLNLPSHCQIGDKISLTLLSVNTWHRTAKFELKRN